MTNVLSLFYNDFLAKKHCIFTLKTQRKRGDFLKKNKRILITRSIQLHPVIWQYIDGMGEKRNISKNQFIRDSLDSVIKRQVLDELISIYEAYPKEDDPSNKILRELLIDTTAIQMIERLEKLKEARLLDNGKGSNKKR